MNMDLWVREQIATQDKKAMPLLSYPAVQEQFITVDQLIHSSSEMALGVRLMADRYKMPFASTYMDLSIEAEAFGAKCTYHTDDIPTITGQLISTQEEADALAVPELGAGRTGKVLRALGKTLTLVNDRPVFANCTGPFSLAGRLMDVNEVLLMTYEEPELVHTVLEKCTQFLLKYIRAMKELNELNGGSRTASNEMVVFVVMNTASLQLMPTMLGALRQRYGSAEPFEILVPVWISSACALTVALIIALSGNRRHVLKRGRTWRS